MPGAYVTVMLYRAMDEKAKRMPGRALGVRWLRSTQAPRTLTVSLDAPRKSSRAARSSVPVKVAGLCGRRGGAHHASPPSMSASST